MIIRNEAQLKKAMMARLEKAMEITRKEIEAKMYEETGNFYTGTTPKFYRRTGALGDTPNTTSLSTSSSSIQFTAYLDQTHHYTTGSKPYMSDVLKWANSNDQRHGIIGRSGFWDRAEAEFQSILNKNLKAFFK